MKSPKRLSRAEFRRVPTHASSQVQVCVRLRPTMKSGQGPNDTCVRGVDSHSLEILNRRNEMETMKYQFDAFYGETATQHDVYMGSVQPLLCHLLEGQNASILAYGPTGAGKTHTMLGSRDQPGVIPRAIRDVLQMTRDASGEEWTYSASMSYLEIYQEKVLDLLEPSLQDLPIREDRNHCILVPGLTEREITSFSDFESYFLPASSNRRVASTQLNQRSSRSHAILLLRIRQKQNGPPYAQRAAKLCLIDLAGSEDNRRTGNRGLLLRESGAINSSLFVLSKVVDALNQGLPRVPYRDSKLTRLLQDSLGGSAHSLIIANIAPEKKYYFDTLTSLNFAAKSKQVVNRPFMQDPVPEPEPAAKRPCADTSDEGPKAKRSCLEEEEPQVVEEKPLSSLLPLENLMPNMAEQLQRLEALEKCQAGVGNLMSPILNTPRKERQGFLRVLEEVRRDLQHIKEKQQEIEALVLPHQQAKKAQREDSIIVIKKSGRGKRNKVSNANSENTAPSEWEIEVRPDLLARGKENILDLLNTGSVKDLMNLRQIGKKKALSIVSWRHQYGPFKKVEDLDKIDGITEKAVASFIKMNVLSRLGSLE